MNIGRGAVDRGLPSHSGAGARGKRQTHAATFAKVVHGRKPPIRGLWIRGTRDYAQLKVENPLSGEKRVRRIPLADKAANPGFRGRSAGGGNGASEDQANRRRSPNPEAVATIRGPV